MLVLILSALALQTPAADTLSAAVIESAYLDPGARSLVAGARARRQTVDRSIAAYEALARERMTVGMRTGFLERMAYRRETVARVDWVRGAPSRLEFLGAREAAPIAFPDVKVPTDLDGDLMDGAMANLAFDPADGGQLLNWGDSAEIRHPFAPGSEAHYRFRSGDTTELRLPDGPLRVIELEVVPRRSSLFVIRGSFWLDAETHAVVRFTFQLGRDVNARRWGVALWERTRQDSTGALVTDTTVSVGFGLSEVSGEDVEGERSEFADSGPDDGWRNLGAPLRLRLLASVLPDVEARLRFITVDYGLWDGEWWMPRLVALEGMMRIMGVTAPLRYERRYDDYSISTAAVSEEVIAARVADAREVGGTALIVDVPEDTASLLASEHMPASIFSDAPWLLDPTEREAVLGALAELGEGGEGGGPPPEPWDPSAPVDVDPLLRYNRVEGLSVGLAAGVDLGPIELGAGARLGTADTEPRGFASVVRETTRGRAELTGYRSLRTLDPASAMGTASSVAALLFAYDEPDYYDVAGASLSGAPPASAEQRYAWRIYAQRETPVRAGTDFSLPHLFDSTRRFRANPAADTAMQYGAELALRRAWGRDPEGFRLAAELRAAGAAGDFPHGGPVAFVRAGFPLPGPVIGSFEAEAGAVWGDPAFQHLRRVGGLTSIRGYDSSTLIGTASWRGRFEIATAVPVLRLALFSDVGWAGPRESLTTGRPLLSAGIGITLLDGLARLDLARAITTPTGWRIGLQLDPF